MKQQERSSSPHGGYWGATVVGALAGAIAIGLAAGTAYADPVPPAPPTTEPAPPPADPNAVPPVNPNAVPPPADPNAPVPPANPNAVPPPADPNAPPAPADPNAPAAPAADPELGRVDDVAGGFSYVLPAGWVESDTSHLEYGSALLSKKTGEAALPGQPPPIANDTRVVLGRLDQRLYASSEADNGKAATKLGSDMGEFFMPYPGTRAGQETVPLAGNGLTGSASYYEVKFTDPAKPVGQIWSGVIGVPPADGATGAGNERWFVVWLGTANNPVDRGAAKLLAESIRPLPPAPPAAPQPGAPAEAPAGGPAPQPGLAPGEAPPPAAPPAPGAGVPAPAAPVPGAPVPGAPVPEAPVPGVPPVAPAPAAPAPAGPAAAPAAPAVPAPVQAPAAT